MNLKQRQAVEKIGSGSLDVTAKPRPGDTSPRHIIWVTDNGRRHRVYEDGSYVRIRSSREGFEPDEFGGNGQV